VATLSALRDRLRLELHDQGSSFEAQIVGNGAIDRFELPVDLVAEGLDVTAGGDVLAEDDDYTMDYLNGVLTLTDGPLADGDELYVSGRHYEAFIDSELDTLIAEAFAEHTHGQLTTDGDPYTYTDLPGVEDFLVVLWALQKALWILATDSSRNVDILVPDGVSIPEGQRYAQLMDMISARKAEYTELASALNVGIHRIQMFTLRRVSRLTNRLVPIYVAKEYDDTSVPVRVLPPIDSGL